MKLALLVGALMAGTLFAQTNLLTVTPPPKLHVKRGETVSAKIAAQLKPGYHCNSNAPAEDYLIPLKLTWKADPLEVGKVSYPKPQMEKYAFSEKPLSVFSGDFEITTDFKVPTNAPRGPAIVTGMLDYQACNDTTCFRRKTVEVLLSFEIQ